MKIKILILLLTLVITQACKDYLDVVPDNVATIDNAFTDRNNAEKYLFTCFSYMPAFGDPRGNPALMSGDEVWLYPKGAYLSGSYGSSDTWDIARGEQNTNEPLVDFWNGARSGRPLWIGIRDCNIFLKNIHNPKDIDSYERDEWIAQIKTLKAFYHFYLLRMYGPIPIIDKNLSIGSSPEDVRLYREPVDKVVSYVVELLDQAIPNLPDKIDDEASYLGKFTKAIAAAIKAKILVMNASPLFNGNNLYANIKDDRDVYLFAREYEQQKWNIALEAIKDAILFAEEKAGHKLYKYKGSIVHTISDSTKLKLTLRNAITEKWNDEVIWGYTGGAYQLQRLCMPKLLGDHGLNGNLKCTYAATHRMLELFYTKNGIPINEDKTWDYSNRMQLKIGDDDHRFYIQRGYETAALHFEREARFYAWLCFDGGIWYGQGRENDKDVWHLKMKYNETSGNRGPADYLITGTIVKKFVNYKTSIPNVTGYTPERYAFPIIRLADLYLLYAEVANEIKNQPDQEIYQMIDKVRKRAGLKGIVESYNAYAYNSAKPTTKEGMRDIIRTERMIELSFEGQRFWDLRRWKLSTEYMNRPIRGWNIFEKDAAQFFKLRTIYDQTFSAREYFWPIKEYNILVNPKLVQNYGW